MTTAGCTVFRATFVAVRWSNGRRDVEEINRLIIVFAPVGGKICCGNNNENVAVKNEASRGLTPDGLGRLSNLADVWRERPPVSEPHFESHLTWNGSLD